MRPSLPLPPFAATRVVPAFLAVTLVAAALFLSSCGGFIENALDRVSYLSAEKPTAENTVTDHVALAAAIADAIEAGKDGLTLNITADEDELQNMGGDIDPFWGVPVSYLVTKEWNDIKLTKTGPELDVKTVDFTLRQSVSYYAYHGYTSGAGIAPPEDIADRVSAVSAALPDIIAEIETAVAGTEGGDLDKALAVHDWLVTNILYDDAMRETDEANGVTGALIGRRTMCQGYAESFELLMRCISEADVRLEVGEGKSEDSSVWIDHAWNLVDLDGVWYQIDATFDDPVNGDGQQPSHVYFGRNDEGMRADHRWDADYWPAAEGGDFLYYRSEGLYAKSREEFRAIVKKLLKEGEPGEIELAVEGAGLDESDLQFVYEASKAVSGIRYSYTDLGAVTIVSLKLTY
jgi:hypothetical protein